MSAAASEQQDEVLSEGRDTAVESAREADAGGSSDDLPLDVVFGALKNARRRRVLRYLENRHEPVSLSDLAEHVAAIENDTSPANLAAQQRKRVYVALYQCHLPKLDDMDVITFNKSRGTIERNPAASQLDKYLHTDDPDARPWHQYYTGFLLLSTATVLPAAVTGIVTGAGAALLFLGICIGIAGIAAVQIYDRRGVSGNPFSELASLKSQLRSRGSQTRDADAADDGNNPSGQSTDGDQLLQKCPECTEVFVSAAPRECQSCKTMTIAAEPTQ